MQDEGRKEKTDGNVQRQTGPARCNVLEGANGEAHFRSGPIIWLAGAQTRLDAGGCQIRFDSFQGGTKVKRLSRLLVQVASVGVVRTEASGPVERTCH